MLPSMIANLSAFVVLIGLVILVTTLVPLRLLIAMLPAGSLRNKWLVLNGLIFIFIASYFGYIVVLWGQQSEWKELPIPGIFLFGAIYVRASIGLALKTAADLIRLNSESITDPLTKLYNRRYLEQRLEAEVVRSKRYSLDLSVLMVDIDHFKQINDRYGHQAGDVTLSTFGSLIVAASREVDIVARYGGEEFLVICTNTAIDEAALVAERLRKLVESNKVKIPDSSGGSKTIQITISIGMAGLSASVDSKKKLVQAADKALYNAKGEGRNRVIVDTPEIKESSKKSKKP